MYKKTLVVSLVSLVACLSGQAALSMGVKHAAPAPIQEFKLIPRVNLWGFSGDYTRGEGQALLPIWGDAGHALYFLAEGNKVVNTSEWMGGAGLGFRQVYNDDIFGGYLIGNYHNSEENNGFYIGNLGLEMLGQAWDINVNGYLPFMQKKSLETSDVIASEDLGITHFVHFSGHNEFDHRLRTFTDGHGHQFGEEAGRGFDAEIGRVIPKIENLRMYLGGYHFDNDDADSVNGVEARAVYEFNRYFALEGEYNYDNVSHSKAVLGLRFTLGGYSADDKKRYGISTRLLDPIEHDLTIGSSGIAEIGNVGRTIDLGEFPIHDNIQFFKPLTATGTSLKSNDIGPQQGDGTFENPFIGFTPANVAAIDATPKEKDAHPLLYFAPGNYNFNGTGSNFQNSRFALPNGWGMFGRTEDYTTPAMGNQRAHFDGGIDMKYDAGLGQDKTTLNSIRVSALNTLVGPGTNATLYALNAGNVIIQNSDIINAINAGTPRSYGIIADHSTISFEKLSGFEVTGANLVRVIDREQEMAGILSTNSTIIFLNGNNTIESILGAGASSEGLLIRAITGFTSKVIFNDGANTLNVNALISYGGLPVAAIGLDFRRFLNSPDSEFIFKGGINNINVVNNGNGDRSSEGIAINNNQVLTFAGGTNTINCSANSTTASASASGILTEPTGSNNPTLNFNGGTNTITVAANGATSTNIFGILLSAGTTIKINDTAIDTSEIANILNVMTINRNTPGTGNGFKIQWGATNLPWTI